MLHAVFFSLPGFSRPKVALEAFLLLVQAFLSSYKLLAAAVAGGRKGIPSSLLLRSPRRADAEKRPGS